MLASKGAPPARGHHYEEAIYAMIGSYMDESFDPSQQGNATGTFVVGGILGRGVPIFELGRRWEQLLKRPDIDVAYFKASECANGWKEFGKFVVDSKNITPTERQKLDSISHEFLELIVHPVPFDQKEYLCVHGVGILQEDFYKVIKNDSARAILGDNPYRLAYDFAMIQCARLMKELDTGDLVSFVCDEHEIYSPLAEAACRNLRRTNPNASQYMATFTSADEKLSMPVQAADAAVFEVRRALNLSLGMWKGQLRKQFTHLSSAKVMAIITHSKKEQLEYIVANHKPGEPFKLDALMDFDLGENVAITI